MKNKTKIKRIENKIKRMQYEHSIITQAFDILQIRLKELLLKVNKK